MKAAVLHQFKKWKYDDQFQDPKCQNDHVIIKVKKASICSTDVLRSMETGFHQTLLVRMFLGRVEYG